jgi:hypothetical protein
MGRGEAARAGWGHGEGWPQRVAARCAGRIRVGLAHDEREQVSWTRRASYVGVSSVGGSGEA